MYHQFVQIWCRLYLGSNKLYWLKYILLLLAPPDEDFIESDPDTRYQEDQEETDPEDQEGSYTEDQEESYQEYQEESYQDDQEESYSDNQEEPDPELEFQAERDVQSPNSLEMTKTIQEKGYHAYDDDQFRWHTIRVNNREKVLDLRLIEPYMKVITHGGMILLFMIELKLV